MMLRQKAWQSYEGLRREANDNSAAGDPVDVFVFGEMFWRDFGEEKLDKKPGAAPGLLLL